MWVTTSLHALGRGEGEGEGKEGGVRGRRRELNLDEQCFVDVEHPAGVDLHLSGAPHAAEMDARIGTPLCTLPCTNSCPERNLTAPDPDIAKCRYSQRH